MMTEPGKISTIPDGAQKSIVHLRVPTGRYVIFTLIMCHKFLVNRQSQQSLVSLHYGGVLCGVLQFGYIIPNWGSHIPIW